MTLSQRFAGLLDASPRYGRASRPDGLELSSHARTGQRIPEGFAPDGDQICARTQKVVGVTAALYSTHPDDGDPNAPPYFGDLGERDRADRRSGHAAGLPPSHGSPGRCGCGAIPRSVLISETASAPCASAAAATSAGEAQLGVSFTISGFAVRGADRVQQVRDLDRIGAEHQAGLDVRAGDVELQRSDLVALADGSTSRATSSCGAAHDVDDQRDRQLGELRQVLRQEAVETLVGQPDRVQQAARQLVQPRRRIALARGERDRLGHERGEREAGQQGVTKRTVSGDRVKRA